jgi:NTP pyrophosphatase (non-canonical NTP hydrolase)
MERLNSINRHPVYWTTDSFTVFQGVKNPMSKAFEIIKNQLIAFRNERDWVQFHDPKNLAEAISIEAGELLENFLWKTPDQSRSLSPLKLENVKDEVADIFIFLTYLCEEYKINLLDEVIRKIHVNEPLAKLLSSKKQNNILK